MKRDNRQMQVMSKLPFTSMHNFFIDYIECLKDILIFNNNLFSITIHVIVLRCIGLDFVYFVHSRL